MGPQFTREVLNMEGAIQVILFLHEKLNYVLCICS